MTYTEQLQEIWRRYEAAGMPVPATAKEVAAWAIRGGLWQPKSADMISRCADELARAAREEYRTDTKGRAYRARHPAKLEKDGQIRFEWADIDTASRNHMERAFSLRRKQIVGDCHQLKVDVDHFNDVHPAEPPIQLILDFTDDVAEMDVLDEIDKDYDEAA
jgi:hypothetical protein